MIDRLEKAGDGMRKGDAVEGAVRSRQKRRAASTPIRLQPLFALDRA
jgi:hypothetical protein